MKQQVRLIVGLGVTSALIGALAAGPVTADEVTSPPDGAARPAETVALLAGGSNGAPSYVGPSRQLARRVAATATFQVTYHGFTPAARAAFQAAVDIWATKVTSTVPITVDATFEPLETGVLGSAGASSVWRDFPGAPRPGTWYVDAIANKRAGRQMAAAPDIVASFNSNFGSWYFGTDGRPPAGTYDFESVVLHELGHGLGFLGAGRVTSGLGSVRTSGLPISYDRFTENGTGTKLLTLPDNSAQLAAQLTSNSVFFDSTRVRGANGGNRARLYAPSRWQGGSSYSHLDETTYGKGNPHSLMTPLLDTAEAIHSPGGITRALFRSIGW